MLGLLLLGATCYTQREHSTKLQQCREKEILFQAKEEDRQTMEEALKATGKAGQGPRLGVWQPVLRGTGRAVPESKLQLSRETQDPQPEQVAAETRRGQLVSGAGLELELLGHREGLCRGVSEHCLSFP